jgi:hypothetical protein
LYFNMQKNRTENQEETQPCILHNILHVLDANQVIM